MTQNTELTRTNLNSLGTLLRSCDAIICGCFLLTGFALSTNGRARAQTPAGVLSPESVTTHKGTVHRKTTPAHAIDPAPVADPPPAPPAPEPPKWPLNESPAPPSVRWDSQGLQVEATNSSLRQILDDVATTTGAKVEGLGPDERVFGDYGPGPARDVLSQILNGSSYNVLMLGDEGQGTPREIILSQRTKAGAQQPGQQAHSSPEDDDADQPQPPPQPEEPQQVNRPPMNQPMNQQGAPMGPQQRMLEMQRQQMQMQQQQQQGQPIQPPQQQPQ
jgi:hypothetical protein